MSSARQGVVLMDRMSAPTDAPMLTFPLVPRRAIAAIQREWDGLPKVVGLVAPVGYGKTVAMSALMAARQGEGEHCIWLALDDRDAGVEAVLSGLELRVGRVVESAFHPTQALLRGDRPLAARIDALLEALDHVPGPSSLFIDNLDCCTDPAMGRLLDRLVFGSAASLRLVLSSTRALPYDGARAQLEGMIRQLGVAELAFDEAETRALYGADLCRRIGDGAVAEVLLRTEGWPAAVRMTQIILANAPDPAAALRHFSGSDETIAQLLNRQVLSGFSAEARQFLLRICLLRTFCVDLCREVAADVDVDAQLALLLARNVFVIPLDRNRQWYRLHGMFRDYLRREAESVLGAESCRILLVRAARWCDRNQRPADAVDYALAARSAPLLREILDRIAAASVRDQGQVHRYIEWVEALHGQGQLAGPEAEYWFVWAQAFKRRYDDARRGSAALARRVGSALEGPAEAPALSRRLAILRASIDSLSDRTEDAHREAAAWIASARDDDPFDLAAAHCIECDYLCLHADFVAARRAIEHAREAAFRVSSAYVDAWVAAYAALIPVQEGDYEAGLAEIEAALSVARASLGQDAAVCGTLAMFAAHFAVEAGRDDDGARWLAEAVEGVRTHGFPGAIACGLEAGVKLWRGDDDARISIGALKRIVSAYPPRLSIVLSCLLTRRLLVLGRVEAARIEAERNGVMVALRRPDEGTDARLEALMLDTRIDLLVAEGRFRLAEPLIETALVDARRTKAVARQVRLSLAAAMIALRSDRHALAIRHVARAVRLAATRGVLRPFLDCGEALAALMLKTRSSAWGFVREEEQRFFALICRRIDDTGVIAPAGEGVCERLTARELELLGYLDAGLSNQQIADRIELALTTVKWHLRNLYEKLSVTSRAAALARARKQGLLPG